MFSLISNTSSTKSYVQARKAFAFGSCGRVSETQFEKAFVENGIFIYYSLPDDFNLYLFTFSLHLHMPLPLLCPRLLQLLLKSHQLRRSQVMLPRLQVMKRPLLTPTTRRVVIRCTAQTIVCILNPNKLASPHCMEKLKEIIIKFVVVALKVIYLYLS
jgi:hypothetical protein